MVIKVPVNVGDRVVINDTEYLVRGVHVYIDKDGCASNVRIHIGQGEFITLEVENNGI